MILIKSPTSSPGSRHKVHIKTITTKNNTFKWQTITKKKPSGRSNVNGILVYSKNSKSLKKSANVLCKKFLIKHHGVFINFLHYFNNKTYCGLIKYANGSYSNINLTHGLLPGSLIKCTNMKISRFTRYNLGDTVLLFWLNRRHVFYNVFLFFKNKVIFSKAAGTFCCMVSNDMEKNYAKLKLPSGDFKVIFNQTFVTLGRNSNILQKSIIYGKAGDVRKNGFKPSVRGVAMNPVDHPHGGRTKTNSPEKTPWGKVAKRNK